MKICLKSINRSFSELARINPAFLFGLTVFTGISTIAFTNGWIWALFWGLYLFFQKKPSLLILLLASSLYGFLLKPGFHNEGKGYFSISTLKPHYTPFYKQLEYRGVLTTKNGQIPCSIYFPSNRKHPKANSDYVVEGKIKQIGPQKVILKPDKWHKIKGTWSLSEMRYNAKESFRKFLEKHLSRGMNASFLGSLITGDVEKRELRYQFGKVGLQHLLAISGFHFALLIYFSSLFLDLFLSPKVKVIALLILIHFYFFFVGSLPSVQRSYLLALFYLSSLLIDRHSSPLNLLGAALLIECLMNPWIVTSIGFQLSFLSTAGILFLYRPIEQLFLSQITFEKDLNFASQHGRLLTLFILRAISLSLAVNLAIIPLLLYHFHSFPILSLFYNLFFPFLVSIALFMLLISLLSFIIFPPISQIFFGITDFFTAQVLDLVSYPPVALDYSIRVLEFPAFLIPIYLFALFFLSTIERNSSYRLRF